MVHPTLGVPRREPARRHLLSMSRVPGMLELVPISDEQHRTRVVRLVHR